MTDNTLTVTLPTDYDNKYLSLLLSMANDYDFELRLVLPPPPKNPYIYATGGIVTNPSNNVLGKGVL